MEIGDPSQKICENCGNELFTKEKSKEVKKDTSLRENDNNEIFPIKRMRRHCC
jgi:hypothetical protein